MRWLLICLVFPAVFGGGIHQHTEAFVNERIEFACARLYKQCPIVLDALQLFCSQAADHVDIRTKIHVEPEEEYYKAFMASRKYLVVSDPINEQFNALIQHLLPAMTALCSEVAGVSISRNNFLVRIADNLNTFRLRMKSEKIAEKYLEKLLTEDQIRKECRIIEDNRYHRTQGDYFGGPLIVFGHVLPDHAELYTRAVYDGQKAVCQKRFGVSFTEKQLLAFFEANMDEIVGLRKKTKDYRTASRYYNKEVLEITCNSIAHMPVGKPHGVDVYKAAAQAVFDNREFIPDLPQEFAKNTFHAIYALCKTESGALITKRQLRYYVSKNRYSLKAMLDKSEGVRDLVSHYTHQLVTMVCSSIVHGDYTHLKKRHLL